ncbi:MAG: hypothetical protein AB7L92_01815 [Alphaproteobacteria bacterium]
MTKSFGQGECAASSSESLHSDKIDNCHAIIACNMDTGEAIMFHVWEAALLGLNEEQREAAERFMSAAGHKMAVRVLGSKSYIYQHEPEKEAKAQLKEMGLKFADDIDVNSGQESWQLTFEPTTNQLSISTDVGELLHQQRLFEMAQTVLNSVTTDLSRGT